MKFTELDLHSQVLKAIERAQFTDCTSIQENSIPHILSGQDVAGLAQTGTGKTAAFVLPLVHRVIRSMEMSEVEVEHERKDGDFPDPINEPGPHPKKKLDYFPEWKIGHFILVLVPTRELAEQVQGHINMFGDESGLKSVAIYGGMSYDKQKKKIQEGVHFIVATPGRLIDLYKEHVVKLRQVRAIVFDEADRMFDMGFKDDMKYILNRIPRVRQFLVFSATLNFDVLNVAYEFGSHPIEVNVSKDQPKAENVKDEIFHVGHEEKPQVLLSLVKKYNPKQAIIFSNFKRNVERISHFLTSNGIPSVAISSLLTQGQRNRVMAQFKSENDQNILVATDLAARGLDILGVDLVVNFELPDDPENYVHRIGRTGRAGHQGIAFSLVSDMDVDALARIEDYLDHKVSTAWIDDNDLIKEFESFPKEIKREPYKKMGARKGPGKGRGPKKKHGKFRDRKDGDRNHNERYKSKDKRKRSKKRTSQDSEASGSESSHRDRSLGRHKKSHKKKSHKRSSHKSKSRSQFSKRKPKTSSSSHANKKTSLGKKITGVIKKLFS